MRAKNLGTGAKHKVAGGEQLARLVTTSAFVIPGRCVASNPESRDSGSGASAPSRNDGYRREKTMNGLKILGLAAGIAALLLGSGARAESDFPNRPIHVIVPYPAGGIV